MSVQRELESTLVKTVNNKERIFRKLQFLIETYCLILFSQPTIHSFTTKGQCLQEGNCCVTSADQADIHTFTEAPIQKKIYKHMLIFKHVSRSLLKSRALIV